MAPRSSVAHSTTDDALLSMLRANTGSHVLDSGGAYGRHHERNQCRDIEGEAPSVVTFRWGEIEVEHRIYHWLRERLSYDEEANEAFSGAFREECDPNDDKCWGELREEFPSWFARWKSTQDTQQGCDECDGSGESCDGCAGRGVVDGDDSLYSATGIYGDGEPVTVNSYNEENLLDQTILFTYFELRSGPGRGGNLGSYVVLQIHGGCDVRGGYTKPRVFVVDDDDELAIFDFRRGTISCAGEEAHWWSTDDGHHWYREGACGRGAGRQLEAYERCTPVGPDETPAEGEAPAWQPGVLAVTCDGIGRCPVCGATLQSASR